MCPGFESLNRHQSSRKGSRARDPFFVAARTRSIARRRVWWKAFCGSAAGLAAAACATTEGYGQIDGSLYTHAHLNRYPVAVIAVDGTYLLRENPTPIRPGTHRIRFSAPPALGFTQPPEREETIVVGPCRRYYVAAERISPFTQEWKLVVEHEEAISGCDAARTTASPRN